jgi:RimJ/RimL family protein N-acetyltransferase
VARSRFGLKRILAITTPGNEASARVLAAIGLKPEGMITVGEKQSRLYATQT